MRTKHSPRQHQPESGSIIVLVAVSMVALFGFAALSIDLAHVYQQQRDMQSATDAAALAAAALLTNSSPDPVSIASVATVIAQTNGVSSAEITASNYGGIQVGQWDPSAGGFTSNATPYNAVLVPAKRTVGLLFGPVVGFGAMTPAVHSVAMLSHPNQVYNPVPLMMMTNLATSIGTTNIVVTKQDYDKTGNFGPINLTSTEPGSFVADMGTGCGCTVTNGEVLGKDVNGNNTGNNDVYNGLLAAATGQPVIVAVVDDFPDGNCCDVQVVGFILVQIGVSGSKGNWTASFTYKDGLVGSGSGGPSTSPYAKDRILVE